MKTILAPTDFSIQSKFATDFAAELAALTGCELSLLHLLDMPNHMDAGYYLNYQVVQQMMYDAENRLKELADSYRDKVEVNTFLTMSSPHNSIEKSILGIDAELIVIGTKRERTLKHYFVGSNTEKIMRLSNCPVLTLSEPLSVGGIRKALVAFDPSTANENYFRELCGIRKIFGLELVFVYVNNDENPMTEADIRIMLRNNLEDPVCQASSLIYEHNPNVIESLLNKTHEQQADIIVMNTHGRSGLHRVLNGSVSEKLTFQTKVPTLIYHVNEAHPHFMYSLA
jgi:nucleotide-binding universal stress UspA family protein